MSIENDKENEKKKNPRVSKKFSNILKLSLFLV